MSAIPHINDRRNGVWYYERRVPLDIVLRKDDWQRLFGGKRLWRKSLHTRRKIEALERGLAAAIEFEAILALAGANVRGLLAGEARPFLDEPKVLTPAEYKEVALRERARIADPWRFLSVRANNQSDHAAKFESTAREYVASRAERLRRINMRGYEDSVDGTVISPLTRAHQLNSEHGYNMPPHSDRFAVLVGTIREGMIQADRDIISIIEGALVAPETVSPIIKDAERINKALEKRSLTISESVAKFVAAGGSKGHLAGRTVVAANQALREFVAVIGDKQLHAINRADVQRFVKVQGESLVGGQSVGSIRRHVSPTTIQKKLTFLRSPVAMSIDHGAYEGENPFAAIRLSGLVKAVDRAVMPEKRAFESIELAALFQYPWFSGCAGTDDKSCHVPGDIRLNDSRFWGPVLALYTGCRAAELGGLMVSEVKFENSSPHLIIQPNKYRGTKNGKVRRVPILDVLFAKGFSKFVQSAQIGGHDRLFPDWIAASSTGTSDDHDKRWAAAKWPRAFNRTVVPAALGSLQAEGTRRSVTLHSFRGSFKRMLEDANVPQQYVDDIIGHAKHDLDQRYSGQRSIERLYKATHELDFDNLKIDAP